jgi:hypothetical protein
MATTAAISVNVGGNWTANVATDLSAKLTTVIFNGSGAQTIGGSASTTFKNLTVNKSSGSLTMATNETVAATLAFTSGNITTGSNTLTSGTTAATGTVTASASGYVVGNLKKFVGNGAAVKTFEVGTGTYYTPLTITPVGNFTGTDATTALTLTSTTGEHANIGTAGIEPTKDVNSSWSLTADGFTGVGGATGIKAKGAFPTAGRDAAATPGSFIVKWFNSPTWILGTATTANANDTEATFLLTAPVTASSFAIGESDTTAPTVLDVTSSTANGSYTSAAVIAIQVVFSEAVTVTGTPTLTLATGSPATTAVNYS